MGSRYQPRYVEQLDRDGPSSLNAGAVIGFASAGEAEPLAGAFDLEVADGALGINRCEASSSSAEIERDGSWCCCSYGKFPVPLVSGDLVSGELR